MTLDLDAIKARIPKRGGGDMRALVEEVERLRAIVADCEQGYRFSANKAEAKERAAVVAWLEKAGWMPSMVELFRRGEHRKGEP